MPVIGMTLTSMEAKKNKGSFKGGIKMKSTPKITDVKEITVASLDKKALSLAFEFTTAYEPDIGTIKMGGELLYLDKNADATLKEWKATKKLPSKVSVEVLNHLFRRILIKMAALAEDLQLPPPLQLPRVTAEAKQDANYIG